MKLVTGAVTTTDIASSAVTGTKIVDASVATVDFGDSGISGVQIADGTVTAVEIADGSVTSAKIADGSITSTEITDGSITGTDIANSLLASADLKDEAGVDFYNGVSSDASGSGRIDLTTDWTTANSITLSVPAAGNVTCIGSGYLDWDLGTWSDDALLGWSSSPTGVPVGVQILNFPGTADNTTLIPMTSMYTFTVSMGTQTFYLRSKISSGTATDVDFIYGVGSACMYFPTSYALAPPP
ncbi:MAG: hypothetical protein GXP10_00650 [Gammaproteobacteria bacterium]|nr:hypothetical protein [Gammaproteobacteria bacterium]